MGDGATVLSDQRGVGFFGVLMALLIAAALYFGYFEMQGATKQRSPALTAMDRSRAFACRTNRQNIEREIAMWSVNHPGDKPSFTALEADGGRIPLCPDGGRYSLAGRRVRCSIHE